MWLFKAHRIKVCMPNYVRVNFALNKSFQIQNTLAKIYNFIINF